MIKSTESLAGYHFYSEFNMCRRKWLLHYYFNIVPEWTKPALLFGTIIHSVFEKYYRENFNAETMLSDFEQEMSEVYQEYYDKSIYNNDLERGELMLSYWRKKFHEQESKRYKILMVEKELQTFLPNNKIITCRIDVVLKDKVSGQVKVLDHKTTGSSIKYTYDACEKGDQATCNLYILGKTHSKLNCDIFEPNILYRRGKVTDAQRPGQIYRTKSDLRRFEQNYMAIADEIEEAAREIEIEPKCIDYLFPRCKCEDLKWDCEYSDICRQNITPDKIPVGYKRRETRI